MNKALQVAFVLGCLGAFLLPAQQNKPVLAVLDVTASGAEESRGRIVYSYILDAINKSGMYTLVERSELDKALQEVEFSSSGLVDDSTAVEVGKVTGAEAVLISSWIKEGDKFYLSMRVIDIGTARVTRTAVRQTASFDRVEKLTQEAVDRLLGIGRQADRGPHLAFDAGVGVRIPLGVLREVLGLGYGPQMALSLNWAGRGGSVGIGVASGADLTFTVGDVPEAYRLYSIPVALQVGLTSDTDRLFLFLVRAGAGAAVSILDYPEAEALTSTPYLLDATVAVGLNPKPTLGIYAFGSFIWIFYSGNPYLGIVPGLGVKIGL